MAIVARFAWLVLTPTLISATRTDIDWWRSQAGNVTEYRDNKSLTCALVLKGDKGEFQFLWNDTLPPYAVVERPEWSLPVNRISTASLRIGNTWLTTADGSRNLRALTEPHGLMFLLSQPVEDLLSGAHDLAFQTPDQSFDLRLSHAKVRQMVKALRRCMAQTKIAQKPG